MTSNSNTVYYISQTKKIESGKVTVTGIISSLSTQHWVISRSTWECHSCNQVGSQNYTPPRLVPQKHLDNTSNAELKCSECHSTAFTVNHEYHTAKTIQVIDANNSHNENYDSLEVVLYDESWNYAFAGEVVDITGEIYVQRKTHNVINGNGKKLITVLHSSSLDSKHREKIVITHKDRFY